jgi:hypothetical protein
MAVLDIMELGAMSVSRAIGEAAIRDDRITKHGNCVTHDVVSSLRTWRIGIPM